MFRKPDGAGKGDAPRPINNRKNFENNWDSIFGKKNNKESTTETTREQNDNDRND
jgi:hypothetical protein